MERNFVILKPTVIQRELMGEIISKFERKGIKIVAMKLVKISKKLAMMHYEEHKGKPFFESLVNYIISGPVLIMVMEGENIINIIRKMIGDRDPYEAMPGTIRAEYASNMGHNIIHASDCNQSAKREIDLFFTKEEILDYELKLKEYL